MYDINLNSESAANELTLAIYVCVGVQDVLF